MDHHHEPQQQHQWRAKMEVVDEDEEQDEEEKRAQLEIAGGGGSSGIGVIEREHMFDKVVTPSDVGKLNRLVIPKQHAEKYFPLDSSSGSDQQKGLLLNFEDSTGKPWRFRYSYWNSSQSYVMTKGWSRFVKEKKLDAGDIVSFQRGVGDQGQKLFIDWRRRPDIVGPPPPLILPYYQHHQFGHPHHRSASWCPTPSFVLRSSPHPLRGTVWDHLNTAGTSSSSSGGSAHFAPVVVQSHPVYPSPYGQSSTRPLIFLRPGGGGSSSSSYSSALVSATGGGGERMVIESVPVVQGKRLRLFGVNMDCPISNQDHDYDDSSSASASSSSNHLLLQQQQDGASHSTTTNTNTSTTTANYYSDPQSLQLRLRSDFLDKGKSSSSSSSMSLNFDF